MQPPTELITRIRFPQEVNDAILGQIAQALPVYRFVMSIRLSINILFKFLVKAISRQ